MRSRHTRTARSQITLSGTSIWRRSITLTIRILQPTRSPAAALETIEAGEKTAPYRMSKNGADWLIGYYDQLGAGLPVLGVKYNDTEKKVVNPLEDSGGCLQS